MHFQAIKAVLFNTNSDFYYKTGGSLLLFK